MPRFPDYRSEIGLNPGTTPQVRTGAEQIGQGLQSLGQGLSEAATGLAAAYQAKIARENAFDDQVKFNQRSQQRQAELAEAARTMPPGATGFATGILQSTQKGDSTMLDAISPANRPAFAGRLADDREALLDQAATLEQQGRSRYEAGKLDDALAVYEQAVAQNPAMRPAAQQAYFDLVDKAGSQSAAAKAERRQAGGLGLAIADWRTSFKDDPQAGAQALGLGRDGAPADPRFASIPPAQRQGLVNENVAQQSGRQALARGALEATLQNTTTALTTIGRHDGPLPDEARFIAAYGREEGARRYADFQHTVNLGADIDTIKAMTPEGQSSWLAGFAPEGDGSGTGSDSAGARNRYAQAQQAIALNRAIRRKEPNAYVRSLHPEIDQLWNDAGTSPERLKTALLATNAAMDRLGMPAEGRALLPKGIIDKALAAFGDTGKPLVERLAPLRGAITASADPKAQQVIFAQMVSSGLPPMLEYTAAAYAKGDAPLAERLASAALGSPGPGEQPGGADAAGSFFSPAAAANAATGPAAPRSLSGPAIDLGPAAAQAIGSSLLGDERAGRTEALRARMIGNAMRSNGGDRVGAIAQTDRDLASLQEDGWVPGMFMQAPIAGAGTQFAFRNTGNNSTLPGAVPSTEQRLDASSPRGSPGTILDQFVRTPVSRQRPLPTTAATGLGAGVLGALNERMSALLLRSIVRPVASGPSYQDTPVPQYYTVQTDAGTAVILPGATIKQVQTLRSWEQSYKSGSAPFDPALLDDHIVDIQNGFNLGVQTALNKLRGTIGFRDQGDTFVKGELDPAKIVSGNGWEFRFRAPTAAGGPVQIVAARFVGTTKDNPENHWENLEDTNSPAAALQSSIRPDEAYAKTYNEALSRTGNFDDASRIATQQYYSQQGGIDPSKTDSPTPAAISEEGTGRDANAPPAADAGTPPADVQNPTSDTGQGGKRKPPRGDGELAPPPDEPGQEPDRTQAPKTYKGPRTGLTFEIERGGSSDDPNRKIAADVVLGADTPTGKRAYIDAELYRDGNMYVRYRFSGETKDAAKDALELAIKHFGPEKIKSITSRFSATNRTILDNELRIHRTNLFDATPQQINDAIAITPTGRIMKNLGFSNFSYEIIKRSLNVTFTK